MELFGIVLNCLELLKSYKWMDWMDGLDGLDPAEKPSPLRATAVLKRRTTLSACVASAIVLTGNPGRQMSASTINTMV